MHSISPHPASRGARMRGMTLIEILVVLVLIGVVMGIVGGNFIGQGENAKRKAAKIEIEQIGRRSTCTSSRSAAIPPRRRACRRCSAPAGVGNWNGPYWKRHTAEGPLGQRVQVHRPGQHGAYDIVSLAPTARKAAKAPRRTSPVGNDVHSIRRRDRAASRCSSC
jgi:general secretion pathway protein G